MSETAAPTLEAAAREWQVETFVDPHLEAMANVYDLSVAIDTEALRDALPALLLPATEVQPLRFSAILGGRAGSRTLNSIYTRRAFMSTPEDKPETGNEVVVLFSQRDVKHENSRQKIVLAGLKKAINYDNPFIRKKNDRFNTLRAHEMKFKSLGFIAASTAAGALGGLGLGETDAPAYVGGGSAFVASIAGLIRYGIPLSQQANIRRHPAQKHEGLQEMSEDLPPIVRFGDRILPMPDYL